MPRGVRFGFDDHHPLGACHHQKVVVVDDHLAFCGSIDLTSHRWDTSAHRVDEAARKTPIGEAYTPYHEVQAMVSGPVAARLGELARDRWRALGADRIPPIGRATNDLWPSNVAPDLTDVDVAIARTMPASESRQTITECEALFLDSIRLANQAIYIESQYFTNDELARALAVRLREPGGPEVTVVAPKECEGWLEKTTMGTFREGTFRQLMAADRHGRLRLVYPAASRSHDMPTFVHSKVMIVDDALLRIGSANCSHRSMRMDTECDLAADAGGDPAARAGIRRIRNRLLAEHLGLPVDAVEREIENRGTIRAVIDARQNAERTLVRIDVSEEGSEPLTVLRAAADPKEPAAVGSSVESLVPPFDATRGRSRLRIWILPAVVLISATVVAWRFSYPLDWMLHAPSLWWLGTAVFVLAAVLLVPLELLAVLAGVVLGMRRGGAVALAGSVAAAAIGYAAGRAIGAQGLTSWISRRSYRSVRQLSAHGVGGVVALHLANVASAGAVHLLCGAGRVPLLTYLAGTIVSLAPAIVALSGLGGLLRATLLDPTLSNGFATIGAATLLLALTIGLRTLLVVRQFAPAVSSHRRRVEFG
jgi:uncharacterized membrane protein YdjX (TVP38/TMEM64 family)